MFDQALLELRDGVKVSHWIWFVFPQISGLGRSETARKFAIESLAEAEAYLAHPVLGLRLLEATRALLALPGSNAVTILGEIDSIKLRSSMTLFAEASEGDETGDSFRQCLDKYFDGHPDEVTMQILSEV